MREIGASLSRQVERVEWRMFMVFSFPLLPGVSYVGFWWESLSKC